MQYTVKTAVFEGPFDLLLTLIEKRKLHVNDISLATVTDDYISHVNNQEGVHLGETAHFILIASTLLLIKSRSLLPVLTLSEEEEGDVRSLERRLRLYELFRGYAQGIRARFGKTVLYSKLDSTRAVEPVFSPSKDLQIDALRKAAEDLIRSLPKKEVLAEKTVQKVISLEEMIGRLSERVGSALRMSFRDFAGVGKAEKVNVIVSFLAMLELVKQGALSVIQESRFGDINMESDSVGRPDYK